MKIPPILDELRAAFPECRGVGYADFSTDMMLATSAATSLAQERWDALSNTAAQLMSGQVADRFGQALSDQDADLPHYAIVFDGDDCFAFVRSSGDAAYGLCCLCSPGINLPRFLEHSQRTLAAVDDVD